jgi:hypothetical protein
MKKKTIFIDSKRYDLIEASFTYCFVIREKEETKKYYLKKPII